MNHPSDLIDELVKTHLKPALKELGFKSKSSTFFRQNGELVEIISPQKSSWNDANESKFTINLGVYWPKVHEILGGLIASLPPKEYDCTIRKRLGSLFDNGKDFWWSVSPNSDIGQIGADVVEKVRHYELPWLVRATSVDEAIKIAQPRQAIVFLALKGEHAQATALIEEQLAKKQTRESFHSTIGYKA